MLSFFPVRSWGLYLFSRGGGWSWEGEKKVWGFFQRNQVVVVVSRFASLPHASSSPVRSLRLYLFSLPEARGKRTTLFLIATHCKSSRVDSFFRLFCVMIHEVKLEYGLDLLGRINVASEKGNGGLVGWSF